MNKQLKTTIYKLVPAVLISLIATALGLLSLFKSKVPMIQDFGLMLTIGIAVAFLLALFVLLPILVIRTKINDKEKKIVNSKESKYVFLMKKITKKVLKFKYIILIVAVILAGTGFYFDQKVGVETDMEKFMPQDSEALADINELRNLIGSTDRIVLMYETENIAGYDTLIDVKKVTDMVLLDYHDDVIMVGSVSSILDMASSNNWNETNYNMYLGKLPGEQLALVQSTEKNVGIVNIALTSMDDEAFSLFINNLNESITELDLSFDVVITGQSVVEQEMLNSMTSDRLMITLISIALVFIVLLIIFRNFLKTIIAILPIVFIVGWSGGIMYMLGFDYTPLTSTIGALIVGIGTEFTILILMRYYELKKQSKDSDDETIASAIGLMSKPIIVSAVTTIGGFSALVFSDFQILSNFGIMTLINITLALLSSIFVLPALLGIFRKKPKVAINS